MGAWSPSFPGLLSTLQATVQLQCSPYVGVVGYYESCPVSPPHLDLTVHDNRMFFLTCMFTVPSGQLFSGWGLG